MLGRDLKESAAEVQASRQELAHFNRLATMGELTASLAHELSQPLTAILVKAQTARRFLVSDRANDGELLPLLDDLITDARRASGVVRRSRELLSKQAPEGLLDLHQEVRGIARLLAADARRRRVALTLDLADGDAMVRGGRLQLQQVLLNLLINAFDATTGRAAAAVSVRSVRLPAKIEVAVSDTGPGIAPEVEAKLFEPFFTTKPQGMGMGLSICRTIVQNHGGSIRASGNAAGGATFRFTLPLADSEPLPFTHSD
jgi:C4-dicarboxylate-specific signal transduction histidine kinase